jgi:hypothetical protein
MVTVDPFTEQLPEAEKLTGRFEEELAVTVNGASVRFLELNAPKLIVWSALAIVREPVADPVWFGSVTVATIAYVPAFVGALVLPL